MPHDLLKPVDWARHNNPRKVSEEYNAFRLLELFQKFLYEDWDEEGNRVPRDLEYAIRKHEDQRLFAIADKLSSAIGRLRYAWNYWGRGAERFFIVRAYGKEGHVEWVEAGRAPLHRIMMILENHSDSRSAFQEINEFLSDYPADSRFPLVSLKAHHWLTDAFRRSRRLWELCYKLDREPERVGIIRCSVPEQNLHRLRDLRAFQDYTEKVLQFIMKDAFASRLPLRIGDEVYVAYVEDEVEQLISNLVERVREAGFLVRLGLHEWSIEKVQRDGGLYQLKSISEKLIFAGDPELPQLAPERAGEWKEELEESENVLWIRLRLRGSLEDASTEFLDRAEKEVLSKMNRVPEKEPLEQEVNLSPDLLISLAEDLEEFYTDCAMIIGGDSDPRSVTVIKRFDEVLMVKGLENRGSSIEIYQRLEELRSRLLVSMDLVAVLCDGKYPFWRVRENLNSFRDCLVIIRGGRLLRIRSEDVQVIRNVIRVIEGRVSRSQLDEIVKEAGKVDGPEPLKLLIEAKAKEGKLGRGDEGNRVARELSNLIDSIFRRHRDMRVVQEALDLLSSFARRD